MMTKSEVSPHIFQKGQGLQRDRLSSFSMGSLQEMEGKI